MVVFSATIYALILRRHITCLICHLHMFFKRILIRLDSFSPAVVGPGYLTRVPGKTTTKTVMLDFT